VPNHGLSALYQNQQDAPFSRATSDGSNAPLETKDTGQSLVRVDADPGKARVGSPLTRLSPKPADHLCLESHPRRCYILGTLPVAGRESPPPLRIRHTQTFPPLAPMSTCRAASVTADKECIADAVVQPARNPPAQRRPPRCAAPRSGHSTTTPGVARPQSFDVRNERPPSPSFRRATVAGPPSRWLP